MFLNLGKKGSAAGSVTELVRSSGLRHIAFIMDGNGRWAKKRGLPREAGHKEGSAVFKKLIEYCGEIGIKTVTVYALSTENLKNRPKTEIDALMKLFEAYFRDCTNSTKAKDLEIRFIGNREPLPDSIRSMMTELEARTGEKTKRLNIAINYGGRDEIVRSVNKLISAGAKCVTEDDITASLDTGECVPPDIMVRTGGESRISNFLLWQSAYSELYFSEKYWPDFTEKDVDEAVRWFAGRSRRFGGI